MPSDEEIIAKHGYSEEIDGMYRYKYFHKNGHLILKETYIASFDSNVYEIFYNNDKISFRYSLNKRGHKQKKDFIDVVNINLSGRFTIYHLRALITMKYDNLYTKNVVDSDKELLKMIKQMKCGFYRVTTADIIIEYIVDANEELIGTYKERNKNDACNFSNLDAHFLNGLMEGPRYTFWLHKSDRETEYNYKNNKKNGLYKRYDEIGNLICETNYINDVIFGKYMIVLSNGIIINTTIGTNAKCDGDYKAYSRSGILLVDMIIKDGRTIEVKSIKDENERECVLQKGTQYVWKACLTENNTKVYVKLKVPEHAKRITPCALLSAYLFECRNLISRVDCVHVEQIIDNNGTEYEKAFSPVRKRGLTYIVGQSIVDEKFNDDANVCCGAGINVCVYKDQCDTWFPLK